MADKSRRTQLQNSFSARFFLSKSRTSSPFPISERKIFVLLEYTSAPPSSACTTDWSATFVHDKREACSNRTERNHLHATYGTNTTAVDVPIIKAKQHDKVTRSSSQYSVNKWELTESCDTLSWNHWHRSNAIFSGKNSKFTSHSNIPWNI